MEYKLSENQEAIVAMIKERINDIAGETVRVAIETAYVEGVTAGMRICRKDLSNDQD